MVESFIEFVSVARLLYIKTILLSEWRPCLVAAPDDLFIHDPATCELL